MRYSGSSTKRNRRKWNILIRDTIVKNITCYLQKNIYKIFPFIGNVLWHTEFSVVFFQVHYARHAVDFRCFRWNRLPSAIFRPTLGSKDNGSTLIGPILIIIINAEYPHDSTNPLSSGQQQWLSTIKGVRFRLVYQNTQPTPFS